MESCFLTAETLPDNVAPVPIHICRPEGWEAVKASLTSAQQTFAAARGFSGDAGQRVQLPGTSGAVERVLFGAGKAEQDMTGPIRIGSLSSTLPEGYYVLASAPGDWTDELACIGWGLGAYKFDRYLSDQKKFPVLVLPADVNAEEVSALSEGVRLGRDLINTPSNDMGPEALEAAARQLAAQHGADVSAVVGTALLEQNYPMIHAVGRAAHQAPRLVEIEWGHADHPRLAIIGKGITFDTGGVNIKSAGSARLMKKDMGGAAHALALAHMIMANNLPIRLHVLLAIAENAVSAGAYRPGDILRSRAGLTVEIDNTDAEGRLVMADALAKATEDDPTLIMDFATLTGAARVALGPTLPPFFSNREAPVEEIKAHAAAQFDPLWHMPLWNPYNSMLSSPIADMKNAGGSFAGSVTAALFLERFVDNRPWMHLDVYGWNPAASPGHPKGGEMFALRGLYHWLKSGGLETDFSA